MSTDKRTVARTLAKKAFAEGRPLSWFEEIYDLARQEGAAVPWADRIPDPNVLHCSRRYRRLSRLAEL